jgi:hypothetical protein
MKKVLGTVGSILLLLVAMAFGKIIGRSVGNSATKPNIDKVLSQAASQVNANLPMMVDKETRLDTTMGGPGKRFTYFYTFPAYASTELDASEVHSLLSSTVPKNVCGSTDMKPMFKLGVTAIYVYRGNDGAEVTRLSITPQSCGYAP